MRFHQEGGASLTIMKGHKPWNVYNWAELKNNPHESHIWDCSETITGVEDFNGALILLFIGQPDFANLPYVAKI